MSTACRGHSSIRCSARRWGSRSFTYRECARSPGSRLAAVVEPGRGRRRARREAATDQSTRAARSRDVLSEPCYPSRRDDLPRWADVVAAGDHFVSTRRHGRSSGDGSSHPSRFAIGDRQLAAMPGLARAAQQALAEAKSPCRGSRCRRGRRPDALRRGDVALEAIGFAAKGDGLTVLRRRSARQSFRGVRGRLLRAGDGAGANRPKRRCSFRDEPARIGFPSPVARSATGSSIVAAQTHTAIALEATMVVAIVGVGQTTYRRSHPEMSSRELIWAASRGSAR